MIDIIIPVFNAEKFLPAFSDRMNEIRSVTNYKIRLIIIDNNSNDQSFSICTNHLAKSDDLLLKNNINMGMEYSLAAGMKRVEADFVMFFSVDDWLDINFINDGIRGLLSNSEAVFATGRSFKVVLSNTMEPQHTEERFSPFSAEGVYLLSPLSVFWNNFPPDVILARSEILKRCGGFSRRVLPLEESYKLLPSTALMLTQGPLFYTNKPQYYSGKHPGQYSKRMEKDGSYKELWRSFYFDLYNSGFLSSSEKDALSLLYVGMHDSNFFPNYFSSRLKVLNPYFELRNKAYFNDVLFSLYKAFRGSYRGSANSILEFKQNSGIDRNLLTSLTNFLSDKGYPVDKV